jgi:hypothetical protein
VKAIERELDLTAMPKEKQRLVKQQNAIQEMVETGISLRLGDRHNHLHVTGHPREVPGPVAVHKAGSERNPQQLVCADPWGERHRE